MIICPVRERRKEDKMREDKPNIIFILSDDQGIWAAGCYGNEEIKTPILINWLRKG